MKPFLSDKNITSTQIAKKIIKKVIPNDFELSEQFGNFLDKAVQLLNVKPSEVFLNNVTDINDTVEYPIKNLKIIQVSELLWN